MNEPPRSDPASNFSTKQFWIGLAALMMAALGTGYSIVRGFTRLEAQVEFAREEFRFGLKVVSEKLTDALVELREHNREQDEAIKTLRDLHLRESRRDGSIGRPKPDIGG